MRIRLIASLEAPDRDLGRSVRLLASSLRDTGASVCLDVTVTGSASADGRASAGDVVPSPADAPIVDVVHAIGYRAAEHALVRYAGSGVPVLVTFVEEPGDAERERRLCERADGLLVVSPSERRAWHAAAPDRLVVHSPLPVVVPDHDAVTPADGALVVSDATGTLRDALVAAMRGPSTPQLVLVDGGVDHDLVRRATVVVSATGGRHGGLAARAAVHGVPAVVVGAGAAADTVIDGATGLVVGREADVAPAVQRLLAHRTLTRGLGMAALMRVKAAHSPGLAASLTRAAYRDAVATSRPSRSEPGSGADGQGGMPGRHEDLVGANLDLAEQLARRYDGRGQSLEDLVQVANLGLVYAAHRYDPGRGAPFAAFAAPTILGELRRYFRDQAWAVHVPRSVQEAAQSVEAVREDVQRARGRELTSADHEHVGRHAGLSVAEVRAGLQARAAAMSPESLNRVVDQHPSTEVGDLLGSDDPGFSTVEARESVHAALEHLPDRQREVVTMRFFGERTQEEIAAHLGVSQVQVSRTLRRTLDGLRGELAP